MAVPKVYMQILMPLDMISLPEIGRIVVERLRIATQEKMSR